MPIYTVEIDGKTYDIEGDRPPSEAEARAAVGSVAPETKPSQPSTMTDEQWAGLSAGEKMRNVLEWGGKTLSGAFGMRAPGVVDPGRDAVDNPKTFLAMAATGPALGVAKKVPGVVAKGLGVSKARAGANIAEAVTAAKDVPLNVATSIQGPLSEIMQYKGIERMPMAVRSLAKELQSGAPLTVETARKYYPAISRMSAAEFANLTPNMQRLVGGLRAALNTGITEAADTIGKGAQYASGMKEYARAGKVAAMTESAKPALASALRKALEALGIGTGVGTAYRLFKD